MVMDLSRRTVLAATGAALGSGALWHSFVRDDRPASSVVPVPGVTATSDVGDAELDRVVEGNLDFGLAMLRRLTEQRPGENVLVSPANVGFALGMTYAGATGETASQIAETMRFPGDDLHPAHHRLLYECNRRAESATDGELRLSLANAVWGLADYPYRDEYLDLLDARYGAEVQTVDFVDDPTGAREEINGWVADRTGGIIDELFPPGSFDRQTRLVLTSAIYLLADWASQFDEARTRDGAFTALDGGASEVPMMRQTETFPYVAADGVQVVELPYVGEEIGMVVMLPDAGTFERFEAELTVDDLAGYLAGLEAKEGEIVLPRFEFEVGFDLNELLTAMGMPLAFDPARANFDGMVPLEEVAENVFIDDVVHEAYIAVDESGTEAAAASGVSMGADSAPALDFRMVVDRPFLFTIRDRITDATLFLGRVTDVESE